LDIIKRFGLIAAVTAVALIVPTRAASQTPPPVIEVTISLTDLPPAIVNVSVPEQAAAINLSELAPPTVNVEVSVPDRRASAEATTVIVEPAPIPPPQIVYKDRTVEVERIVEVASCLDYSNLPYFDLSNALSAAFPGAQWSLSGSYYNGLVWHDASPMPDMTAIIGGWLAYLETDC
jgi:hypothetical protein